MKTVLAVVAVLAIAVVAIGFWQGWFSFQTSKEDGKVHVDLSVNKDKFKQDKEKLRAKATDKTRAIKQKIASLREKSKGLKGDDKARADKEIEALSRKHDALKAKLDDLEGAGEDKFDELKKSITSTMEEKEEEKSGAGE
jgi:hypothetical protein